MTTNCKESGFVSYQILKELHNMSFYLYKKRIERSNHPAELKYRKHLEEQVRKAFKTS